MTNNTSTIASLVEIAKAPWLMWQIVMAIALLAMLGGLITIYILKYRKRYAISHVQPLQPATQMRTASGSLDIIMPETSLPLPTTRAISPRRISSACFLRPRRRRLRPLVSKPRTVSSPVPTPSRTPSTRASSPSTTMTRRRLRTRSTRSSAGSTPTRPPRRTSTSPCRRSSRVLPTPSSTLPTVPLVPRATRPMWPKNSFKNLAV